MDGSGKSAIQPMPPDQIIGALPSPPAAMTLAWASDLSSRLDADRGEVLLDRLGDARVRVGVVDVELGREAVGEAGLGEELLRALGIVGVALVVLDVARHRGRQRLVRRHRAVVDDADDAVLVDRHVDRLAHAHVVERLGVDVHRHVAGVELAALDDLALVLRVVLDLEELRRRDAVAEHVDLAALQAEERDGRLLAELEGDLVELRACPPSSSRRSARARARWPSVHSASL